MSKLTVIGPNLVDQSKGTFHVHDASCRDLCKYQPHEPQETGEYSSLEEIVSEWFEDIIAEYEPGEPGGQWEDYVNEFHVLPCVKFDK